MRDLKTEQFKEQAANQRSKISHLKEVEDVQNDQTSAAKLTAAALNKVESNASISKASVKSQKNKKAVGKPAWAKTEKQTEENKETEIDNLLEFAYELDYEAYMEDFEVRQALAVIKDRVNEIKQEPDWKDKMAAEWNQANQEERAQAADSRSQVTQKTNATGISTQSYKKRIDDAKKDAAYRPDWDNNSLTSEAKNRRAEDRMASKIAAEVLKDNSKLRGVHSKESIKKILEKEALKQMQAQGSEYPEPLISRINEKQMVDKANPSNLPYLHKNPAV